ncbi:MAG: hypothetical protein ACYCS8_18335 [Acidithiobacillus sp.]
MSLNTQQIVRIVNASYTVRMDINAALSDIDRKALNALVLVKRHGGRLAGYGVIAGAFREKATELKGLSEMLHQQITPLVESYLQAIRDQYYIDVFANMPDSLSGAGERCPHLAQTIEDWKKSILEDRRRCHLATNDLLRTVERIRAGIDEQEYVVINGRIESALSEGSGAPLTQVSRDMGVSVKKLSGAIRKYEQQLGELEDFNL